MTITLLNIFLAFVVCISLFLMFGSVLLILGKIRKDSASVNALGSFLIVSLTIIAEVYLLSLFPIERPLRFLWVLHITVVSFFVFITLYKWKITAWRELWNYHMSIFLNFLKTGSLVLKFFMGVFVLVLSLYFFTGIFFAPSASDSLSYHISLAVQPYQDGKIGHIDSDLPWTYLYPRGSETIWYWTLQLTQSDLLFNAVQLFFGFNLLLAIYVLSKKIGNGIHESFIAATIFLTMPLFYILTISGYIDMNYGASILIGMAFLAPSQDRCFKYDAFFALLALSLATLIKIPIIAVMFIGIMFCVRIFSKIHQSFLFNEIIRFFKSKLFFLSLAVLLFSSLQYIRNWFMYNNPIYPIGLHLFGKNIFNGIINPTDFGLGINTLMGNVNNMGIFQRFYSSWADIFNNVNVDSFGSTGPIFILAIIFPFAIFSIKSVIERKSYHISLVVIFLLSFVIPGLFTPRYNLVMIAIGIIGAINIFIYFDKKIFCILKYVLLFLCILAISIPLYNIKQSIVWVKSLNNGRLDFHNRSSIVAEKVSMGGYENYPTANVIKYIRDNSRRGDILVWNVNCFQALLWNRTYSNHVIFLPGTEKDRWPEGPSFMTVPNEKQAKDWKDAIEKMKPQYILVYRNSIYPSLIMSLETNYEIGYKETDNNFSMEIFKLSD